MIGRHRRAVGIVLALHSAAAVAGLAPPWLLGTIVDRVTAGAGVATVDRLALAIAGCVLVSALLSRYAQYAGHRFGERAVAELREEFVSRTLGLPVSVVERAGSGDLATRSSVDVATVGTTVRDVVPTIVIAGVQLTLLFGAVFLLHPLLGLAALAGLPSIVAVTRWYLRRASSAYLTEGAAAAELTETLTTTAEGARTVEALRLTDDRIRHGTGRITQVWRARRATLALRTVFFSIVEASYPLPVALVLLVGGYLLSRDMVIARRGGRRRALPATGDRPVGPAVAVDRAGAARFRVVRPGPRRRHGPAGTDAAGRPRRGESGSSSRGARFSYSDGPDVLHGIDLEVQPGERLAVVGPSGAGKSTLARLLAGIDAPRQGVVSIGGCPITDLDPAERRRRDRPGHPGAPRLHRLGTRQPLASPRPDASDEQMRAALVTVGADWYADLPDGLDTPIGDGARQLGAAEAQQLALARLVLADPHTLILDEATAALDPTHRPPDRAGVGRRAGRADRHRDRAPAQHRARRRPGGGAGRRPDHRDRQPR